MGQQAERVRTYLAETARVLAALQAQADLIEQVGQRVVACLDHGGKILTAGNGGSAAEALHLAEELTGKYARPRKALAALCLNADPTALTCIANDWDFSRVFSRQVEALARPGDLLVVFSTSGRSPNILRALEAMKQAGGATLALLGRDGGPARPLADLALVVPSDDSGHIQEAHQAALHAVLEVVEAAYGN